MNSFVFNKRPSCQFEMYKKILPDIGDGRSIPNFGYAFCVLKEIIQETKDKSEYRYEV